MEVKLPRELGYREAPYVANLRCPVCGHMGAFHSLPRMNDLTWDRMVAGQGTPYSAGMRICPNEDCRALLFVVLKVRELEQCYPPEVLDFDSTNLPKPILSSLEEAIKCHALQSFSLNGAPSPRGAM